MFNDLGKFNIITSAIKRILSNLLGEEKLNSLINFLQPCRKLLLETTYIALIISALVILVFRVTQKSLVVTPLDVPPYLTQQGYSPKVVAINLRDRIFQVYDNSTIQFGNMTIQSEWQDSLAGVQIIGTGLSLDRIIHEIKNIIGSRNIQVGGELIYRNKQVTGVARIDNREIYRNTVYENDLPLLLEQMGENVVKIIDPQILAMYYYQKFSGISKTIEQMNYALTHGSDEQRAYAYVLAGQIAMEKKNYEVAKNYFQKAVNLDSDSYYAYNSWGNAYFYQKKYGRAIEKYQKVIELNPEYSSTYHNWGIALSKQKLYKKAFKKFDRALELEPDDYETYYSYGLALKRANMYEEALKKYDRALELKPDDSSIYYAYGIALSKVNRYEEAIVKYKQAVQYRSDYYNAYNNMAYTLALMGRLDEAKENIDKALKIKPDLSYAINTKAFILNLQGNYQKAIILSRKSIRIEADDSYAYRNWGWALHELGRHAEANKKFIKISEKDPSFSAHLFYWGKTLEALNRPTEALKKYKLFLEDESTKEVYKKFASERVSELEQKSSF